MLVYRAFITPRSAATSYQTQLTDGAPYATPFQTSQHTKSKLTLKLGYIVIPKYFYVHPLYSQNSHNHIRLYIVGGKTPINIRLLSTRTLIQ